MISSVLRNRFLRNAGTISGGAALSQIIAFSAAPVLTRLYSPDVYGIFGLALAFVTLALTMSSAHYEMAIALPAGKQDGAALALLAIFLGGAFAVLLVPICAPWGVDLFRRAGFRELTPYWCILPSIVFASCIQQALQLWHLRQERYREVAINGVAQSAALNAAPIALALAGFQTVGLIIGLLASRLVAAAGLAIRALKTDRNVFRFEASLLRRVARQYRSLPTVGLPGAVLHMACLYLPAFLLARWYGTQESGFYLLQDRVLGVPLAVLSQGAASVFYVNAAKMAIERPAELQREYTKAMCHLAACALFPMVILLTAGPWLFRTVFGEAWETAGLYARIMAVPMFLRFVAGPLYRCLTILNSQKWIVLCDGLACAGLLLTPSVFGLGSADGTRGVLAVAIIVSAAYAGLLASTTITVFRHTTRQKGTTSAAAGPALLKTTD
jgi:O-antigen/teichoic acid export membrane protein